MPPGGERHQGEAVGEEDGDEGDPDPHGERDDETAMKLE